MITNFIWIQLKGSNHHIYSNQPQNPSASSNNFLVEKTSRMLELHVDLLVETPCIDVDHASINHGLAVHPVKGERSKDPPGDPRVNRGGVSRR